MKKERPLLLSIDTATVCSTVALTEGTIGDGLVVATVSLASRVTHSRRLISAIDWLFKEAQVKWAMIDGIGVGLGPGSFTGLRIGMATAKGLATASRKSLIGVSTLDCLASSCGGSKQICAVLDARKKEVYASFYQTNPQGAVKRISEIRAVSPEGLAGQINEPTLMVGDGVLTYGDFWRDRLGDMVCFAQPQCAYPSSAVLGLLACEEFLAGNTLEIDEAIPLYVRSTDAELSLVKN